MLLSWQIALLCPCDVALVSQPPELGDVSWKQPVCEAACFRGAGTAASGTLLWGVGRGARLEARASGPLAAAFRAHLCCWPRCCCPVLRHQRRQVLGVPRLQRDGGEWSGAESRAVVRPEGKGMTGTLWRPTVTPGRGDSHLSRWHRACSCLLSAVPSLPSLLTSWEARSGSGCVRTDCLTQPGRPGLRSWLWMWGRGGQVHSFLPDQEVGSTWVEDLELGRGPGWTGEPGQAGSCSPQGADLREGAGGRAREGGSTWQGPSAAGGWVLEVGCDWPGPRPRSK